MVMIPRAVERTSGFGTARVFATSIVQDGCDMFNPLERSRLLRMALRP